MRRISFVPEGTSLCNKNNKENNFTKDYFTEYSSKNPKTRLGTKIYSFRLTLMIMKHIIEEIRENLIEKQGGVYINDFGYFFVWRAPKKRGLGSEIKDYLHTIQFKPVRTPLRFTGLFGWTIYKAVRPEVRERISTKIETGFKYKNYIFTLDRLAQGRNKAVSKRITRRKQVQKTS